MHIATVEENHTSTARNGASERRIETSYQRIEVSGD
jgi:hypothetical protein